MNEKNERITRSLLKVLRDIENMDTEYPELQVDIMDIIMLENGIHKGNDKLYVCDPVFRFIENEIEMNDCIKELRGLLSVMNRDRINSDINQYSERLIH